MSRSFLYIGIGVLLIAAALLYSTRNGGEATLVTTTVDATPLPPLEALIAQITPNADPDAVIYPAHVAIDDIGLNAIVTIVGLNAEQYVTLPDDTAGFWDQSTPLSGTGNTVLVGHSRSEPLTVFRPLQDVEQGARAVITGSNGEEFAFVVKSAEIIQVANAPESEANRVNQAMTVTTDTAQLTLIACYPDNECTHRVVVIAAPIDQP